jgi:anti-sigma factor ChrR (cupin superfamily)
MSGSIVCMDGYMNGWVVRLFLCSCQSVPQSRHTGVYVCIFGAPVDDDDGEPPAGALLLGAVEELPDRDGRLSFCVCVYVYR